MSRTSTLKNVSLGAAIVFSSRTILRELDGHKPKDRSLARRSQEPSLEEGSFVAATDVVTVTA
jgi:hypothetical protein